MQNLEIFYTAIQDKITSLEVKERQRIQDEITTFRQKNQEDSAKWREQRVERDIFYWKLQIKYKLFLALSKYIKDSDVLTNFTLVNGAKGLQIRCSVEREGLHYSFETEAIPAGGYNIQCFHYRYIIITDLEPVNSTTTLNKFFKLNEEKEQLQYLLEVYKQKPLTVTTYTTQEWQEKNRQNNIKNYEDRIAKLQTKIDSLKI